MAKDGEGMPRSGGETDASAALERELLDRSMRDFAEGATALTAASLRLQMLILEQMREMLGDLSGMIDDAVKSGSGDDRGKDD